MNPFSTRCILSNEWRPPLIKHFIPAEFPHPNNMGFEFMLWLDKLRDHIATPLTLTSSYRSTEYNALIGGAKDSAHCDIPCNAIDIGERPLKYDPNWNHTRWLILTTAIEMGCNRIGLYLNGSIHLDMTHDKRPGERIWRIVGSLP